MKTKVEVELSHTQEIALMDRYGRKCSRETLVKRAIAEAIKMNAEDIPVFISSEERKAEEEAEKARGVAEAEATRLTPEAESLLAKFKAGERLVDLEGREVSALEPAENGNVDPLIAQFGGDNSEWYPVSPNEIKSGFATL